MEKKYIATRFLECIRDCYFIQYVKEYTRIRENNEPIVLDLLFSSEENMTENSSISSKETNNRYPLPC